jgi:hypothetical protein
VTAPLIALSKEVARAIDCGWWCNLGTFESRCEENARQPFRENGHVICRSQIQDTVCLAAEDHRWNWLEFFDKFGTKLGFQCLAVQTPDKRFQGAIVYRWNHQKSLLENGEVVFVEYIATAPQNRRGAFPKPRYNGVGTGLMFTAMRHSYELGFEGRIGLDAAPGTDEEFYIPRFGFVDTGIMGQENGRVYKRLELPSRSAKNFLRDNGLLRD